MTSLLFAYDACESSILLAAAFFRLGRAGTDSPDVTFFPFDDVPRPGVSWSPSLRLEDSLADVIEAAFDIPPLPRVEAAMEPCVDRWEMPPALDGWREEPPECRRADFSLAIAMR